MAHDLDIVAPVCTKRGPPFSLVIMDEEVGLDEHGRTLYRTLNYDQLPDQLFEVPACGTAGMMIKRDVFDELGFPWFANSDGITINEDMEFCRRARAHGYKIMVDPDTKIGHIGQVTSWPDQRNGEWGLVLSFQNEAEIWLPGGAKPEGTEAKGKMNV